MAKSRDTVLLYIANCHTYYILRLPFRRLGFLGPYRPVVGIASYFHNCVFHWATDSATAPALKSGHALSSNEFDDLIAIEAKAKASYENRAKYGGFEQKNNQNFARLKVSFF